MNVSPEHEGDAMNGSAWKHSTEGDAMNVSVVSQT